MVQFSISLFSLQIGQKNGLRKYSKGYECMGNCDNLLSKQIKYLLLLRIIASKEVVRLCQRFDTTSINLHEIYLPKHITGTLECCRILRNFQGMTELPKGDLISSGLILHDWTKKDIRPSSLR